MNSLTSYIFRQCLALTLIVTGALTAAFWLVQSLKLIELVVDRGVGIGLFIELMVLSLPQLLQLVLPVGCFIGVLFTCNKLIGDSELVVMRACGASQWDLARPAVLLGGIGTLLMLSLSLYFLPASKNAFKDLQFQIRNQFTSGLLQEGAFNTLSDQLTVYVRSRTASGALEGLLIQDTRDPAKASTYTAESGLITQVEGEPNVLMLNGTKEVWDGTKKQLSMLTFDRYSLNLNQFRDVPGARVLQPDERYIGDLFDPSDVTSDPVLRERLLVEGHNRLVGPLYCLSYVAVALASLLTGELNRRGQAKRLLTAIALVVALQASALGVVNMADRSLGALPLMYLNAILPAAVGIGLVLYGQQWRVRRSLLQTSEGTI
jgi:lipopolysaccharide export system permease protein